MVTGCPGTDGPTTGTGAVPDLGDNTGTDDGGDAPDVVEVEDKYVPPPPPPGECALFIDKPTSNQDTFGSVEIVGTAVHESLKFGTAAASVQLCKCRNPDPDDPDPECSGPGGTAAPIAGFVLADGTEPEGPSKFTVTGSWSSEGHPYGKYCLLLKADTVYAGVPHETWEETPPACFAEVEFWVDNDCPRFAPKTFEDPEDYVIGEGGTYFEKMPVKFSLLDESRIASVTLKNEAGEVVEDYVLEKTEDDNNPFSVDIDAVYDVCELGTGVVTFSLEVADDYGNACSYEFKPRIIRCPLYVTANSSDPDDKVVAKDMAWTNFVAKDLWGKEITNDSYRDVVVATADGIFLYLNDGEGGLNRPVPIRDLHEPAIAVMADDLNKDGLTDFITLENAGTGGVVSVYIQSDTICAKDESYKPDEEGAVLEDLWPVVCRHGWGLAEQHELPANITAHLYERFMPDIETWDGEAKDKLSDLLIGTDDNPNALLVMARSDAAYTTWTGPEDEPLSAHPCSFWPRSYYGQDHPVDDTIKAGDPVDPKTHEVTSCFREYKAEPSTAGINSIALENFIEEPGNPKHKDVVVSRGNKGLISIFKHDGKGNLDTAGLYTIPEGVASQIVPYGLNADLHMDLLIVLPELGEVREIYGNGNGEFLEGLNPVTQQPFTKRRSICVEGKPSAAAVAFINDDGEQGDFTDLVVANKDTGTLWALWGKQTLPCNDEVDECLSGGYQAPRVVDALPDPVQVIVIEMNKDAHPDVLVRSSTGEVAVLLGAKAANPAEGLPVTNPAVGVVGTFIGATNVTTPVPTQSDGAIFECKASNQSANGSVSLGLPLDRLEPQFMLVEDVDDDNELDLVMIAEPSPTLLANDAEGQQKIPVLTYYSDGILPVKLSNDVSEITPVTSYCIATGPEEEDQCEQDFGPIKGDVTGVAAGTFDITQSVDLAVTTNTYFPSSLDPADPEYPNLKTVDIMYNAGDGTYSQLSKKPSDNPQLKPPGEWYDYGLMGWSRPKGVTSLHCASEVLAAIAIVGERQTDEETRSRLIVYAAQAGKKWKAAPYDYVFNEGVNATGVIAARLGPIADGDPDPQPDLLVVTKNGVQVFTGSEDTPCYFTPQLEVDVGGAPTFIAARDINGNGRADIVAPLANGTVSITLGLDGVAFDVPDVALFVEDATLGQPAIVDVNGDSFLDITVLDTNASTLYVFPGTGPNGSFWTEKPHKVPIGADTISYQFADLDGDDCLDLLSLSPASKAARVFRSRTSLIATCEADLLPEL